MIKSTSISPINSRSALRTVTFSDVEESFLEKTTDPSSPLANGSSTLTSGTGDFYSALESTDDEDEFFDLKEDEEEAEERKGDLQVHI